MKKIICSCILLFSLFNIDISYCEDAMSPYAAGVLPYPFSPVTADDPADPAVHSKKRQVLFPPDVLAGIITYADSKTVVALGSVNKKNHADLSDHIGLLKRLCADNKQELVRVIRHLLARNISVVKPTEGLNPYHNVLTSFGYDMNAITVANGYEIAESLARTTDTRLITKDSLEAYVAERLASLTALVLSDRNIQQEEVIFVLTQSELRRYKDQLNQLPVGDNYYVLLIAEPDEKGVLKLSIDDLPKNLKHLHIVDPHKRVTTLGYNFCYYASVLRILTLDLPVLEIIGKGFCSYTALQNLIIRLPALITTVKRDFFLNSFQTLDASVLMRSGGKFCLTIQALQSLILHPLVLIRVGAYFCSSAEVLHLEVKTTPLDKASRALIEAVRHLVVEGRRTRRGVVWSIDGQKELSKLF